jgi:hypothetical protein
MDRVQPPINSGLSRISETGGEAEELTTPDRKAKEKAHRFPEVLPGGKAVLFTLGTGDIASFDEAAIVSSILRPVGTGSS